MAEDREEDEGRCEWNDTAGAERGRGGRSFMSTAVGGRGWDEGLGLSREPRELEENEDSGGAERGRGSTSSSWSAGRSRMSMLDMESFIPGPLCPRFRRWTLDGLYPSSSISSSESLVNSRCRGGEDGPGDDDDRRGAGSSRIVLE